MAFAFQFKGTAFYNIGKFVPNCLCESEFGNQGEKWIRSRVFSSFLKCYFRFYISINVQIVQFYNFFAYLLYPDFDKLCNFNTLDHLVI